MGTAPADRLKFFNTHAGLADKRTFKALRRPAAAHRVGGPLQGAVRRTPAGPALSLPLHASCRNLEPPPRCRRRCRHRVPFGRTIASTARAAGRRCGFTRTSSSGASCCTCCPRASATSATTGSSPPPTVPRASRWPAHSSMSPRPAPEPQKAARCRAGRATCAGLPMPALRRSQSW
jgi:hypothetical protein